MGRQKDMRSYLRTLNAPSVMTWVTALTLVFLSASLLPSFGSVATAQTPVPRDKIIPPAPSDEDDVFENDYLEQSYERGVPIHQQIRPSWGFQFATAVRPVRSGQGVLQNESFQNRTLAISAEYQPLHAQRYGIFGLGPSLVLGIPFPDKMRISLYGAGAQFRYQARFLREQWVVPTFGMEALYLRYYLKTQDRGGMFAYAPSVGAMFLLNRLDEETAASFYQDSAICRSYLIASAEFLRGSAPRVFLSGTGLYVGLRFEY